MKRFFVFISAGAVALSLSSCSSRVPERIQYSGTAMGTVIQQTVYTSARDKTVLEDIQKRLQVLEENRLSWRLETSEIYEINSLAGEEEGVLLSEETAEMLERCLEMNERSEGAFDVTMGPVVRLWNLDSWAAGKESGDFIPPDTTALAEALAHTGSSRLYLSGQDGRLYLPEGMALDLGAVGKGIALDEILNYLRENNEITGATISVGGSILTYGEKPDGTSWRVGIINPFDNSGFIGVLSLKGQWCVSTSGDYERYVEAEGIRYHHIIEPSTGYPADSGLSGVTILSRDGFLSDALSTACFILGREKGMRLAEQYGAEALFVEKDGTVTMTEGMKPFYTESQ